MKVAFTLVSVLALVGLVLGQDPGTGGKQKQAEQAKEAGAGQGGV